MGPDAAPRLEERETNCLGARYVLIVEEDGRLLDRRERVLLAPRVMAMVP